MPSFFQIFYLYIFRKRWRKKERERNINVWEIHQSSVDSHIPPTMPWLGVEPVTFQFVVWYSIHWATPPRAAHVFLLLDLNNFSNTPTTFEISLCSRQVIFFYCCSSTFVSIFTPPIPVSHPQTHPLWLSPCVLHTCSLMASPLSPIIPLLPPLWLPSDCSLFQHLWLYFACLFVPLIGEIIWYFSFTT